jgi:hypothetical protein
MTHTGKKSTHNYSNAVGDKKPPCGTIDSYHKLPMRKKRKNIVGKAEEPETECDHTPRDHMLTIKDFRDTYCMSDSIDPNYFVLGRMGPRYHLLIGKDFRDTCYARNYIVPNYFVLGGRG